MKPQHVGTILALALTVAGAANQDFQSENKATGVRPDSAKQKGASAKQPTYEAKDLAGLVKQDGQQVIVKGKVHSTYLIESGGLFILNFGPDFRKCFKVVIGERDFKKWSDGVEGIKRTYQGKDVTVEGIISLYRQQPQVRVQTPGQLKLSPTPPQSA